MTSQKILITGVTGFVGQHLAGYLIEKGFDVWGVSKSPQSSVPGVSILSVTDITEVDKLPVQPFDTVIHLAAKVHDTKNKFRSDYFRVNVVGTQKMAEYAEKAGAKRFIFLSSIKVNGERTNQKAFSEHDIPMPEDDYGRSKLQAETLLKEQFSNGLMQITSIRTPLIYGRGVKANFASLANLTKTIPLLPFRAFKNKRSFIGIENLIGFISSIIKSDKIAGEFEVFLRCR